MGDDAEVVLGVNKKGRFSMESPFFDVFGVVGLCT